jgi:hypothetical protein
MVRYFFNFWVWWYVIIAYDLARFLLEKWGFLLNLLNLPAMVSNMFVPLYQDYSWGGKFISFIIRFVWVFFGTIVMVIATVPIVLVYVIYLLLPLMPVFAFLGTFIKWF